MAVPSKREGLSSTNTADYKLDRPEGSRTSAELCLMTSKQAGEIMGITKQAAHALEKKALWKLRRAILEDPVMRQLAQDILDGDDNLGSQLEFQRAGRMLECDS